MKPAFVLILTVLVLLLTACSPACPPESIQQVSDIGENPSPDQPAENAATSSTSLVEIKRKMIEVDRVIEGPLCNDTWSGTIYVSCDIQVAEWEEKPTFLRDCDLNIEEGTVVYVAAHNDKAYLKGCSCHE